MTRSVIRPPPFARWVAGAFVPRQARADVIGDLHERFLRRAGRYGGRAAARWCYREAALLALAALREAIRHPWAHRRRSHSPRVPMAILWQDVHYALRGLRKSPVFTLMTVAILGLGIGANTAIFSVVYGVVLRPLPYPDPGHLYTVWPLDDAGERLAVSPANFADLVARQSSLASLEASLFQPFSRTMDVDGTLHQVMTHMVTPGLFGMLGADAAFGRLFREAEGVPGNDRVVVLSYGVWQRLFGADSSVIDRPITIAGRRYTVVGIVDQSFYFETPDIEVWMPFAYDGSFHFTMARDQRRYGVLNVVGRLGEGATIARAAADLSSVLAGLAAQYPEADVKQRVAFVPLRRHLVSDVRGSLMILFGAVGTVLVITCLNVAVLMVARSLGRARELATRAALGAGRGRLTFQALVESLTLGTLGGAVGIVVGSGGVRLLLANIPGSIPRQHEVALDGTVLAFTLLVSVTTGVLFGLLPARFAARADLHGNLRDRVASVAGAGARRVRGGLVVAEVALAVVLLVGAGLLGRSFAGVLAVDPGFAVERLLVSGANTPSTRAGSTESMVAYFDELFDRIRAVPGVVDVAGVSRIPLTGEGVAAVFNLEGDARPSQEWPEIEFRRASPNYFSVMGIPLLEGRRFGPEDTPGSTPAAIINAAAQREFFAGASPIGRRVRWSSQPDAPWYTVVGVVGDVRHFGLDTEPRPELYISTSRGPNRTVGLLIRTAGDPMVVAGAVRAVTREMNPDNPPVEPQAMTDLRRTSIAVRRFSMSLVGSFALLALILVGLGIYGVITHLVAERTGEFGIRMALGAPPSDILRGVALQSLSLAGLGIGIGAAVSLVATRSLRTLLYGVGTLDPVTLSIVPIVVLGVAVLAAVQPARRAGRVDPITVLHNAD